MTLTLCLLAACAATFATKWAGHLVPPEKLHDPRLTRIVALVTVALLAALVGVQALAGQSPATRHTIVFDARLAALAVAAMALLARAPFAVVVVLAAVTAAALRAFGIG